VRAESTADPQTVEPGLMKMRGWRHRKPKQTIQIAASKYTISDGVRFPGFHEAGEVRNFAVDLLAGLIGFNPRYEQRVEDQAFFTSF
jgi:hypothetical protein